MEAIIYQNTIVKVGNGHELVPLNQGSSGYDIKSKDNTAQPVCHVPGGIYVKDWTLEDPAGFAVLTFE